MYGPEDEGLILKGTYAYNFVDGDLSSFKLSFEETDCELHDLTLTVNGVEEAFPITLSEDNTGEVKLDVPMEKPELSGTFIQLEGTSPTTASTMNIISRFKLLQKIPAFITGGIFCLNLQYFVKLS